MKVSFIAGSVIAGVLCRASSLCRQPEYQYSKSDPKHCFPAWRCCRRSAIYIMQVTSIHRLRAKLAADIRVAAMLETVRGVGYQWNPNGFTAASQTHRTLTTPETVSRCPERQISQPHL